MDYGKLSRVVDSVSRQKINKVVNYENGVITVLEDLFSYDGGFKGATGAQFEPVSEEAYEDATSHEALVELLEGASELPEDYESYDDWADAIEVNGEAGDVAFDLGFSSLWDMMRAECGLSDEEAYVFNCIGCGRIFSANYQGNVNPELSEKIREAESK